MIKLKHIYLLSRNYIIINDLIISHSYIEGFFWVKSLYDKTLSKTLHECFKKYEVIRLKDDP